VWPSYLAGELEAIRNYCETDVLNTYLIYLRFELMRGSLNEDAYNIECELVRSCLSRENKPHFKAFLRAWAERS
jgi:predicted PolB exonuclease-like 3'-5' exonuclease